jgi:hypothetical protein
VKHTFQYGDFSIQPVYLELEINYVVFDSEGYFCRLVPGEMGLELSKLDTALDNKPERNLITKIADFIFQKNA